MMPTDTLTCQVTPDSVEPTSLSCSMPPLEWIDLWTTVGSIATAIFTLALVCVAIWAGRIAVSTLRQMKADSISQTRPYVYAHIVPSIGGSKAWDLVLKNTGQSSAYELTITVDSWPESDKVTEALKHQFSAPQTLPPGCAIRSYWFLGQSENRAKSPVGFDQKTRLSLTYMSSMDGNSTYIDHFDIDVNALKMTPVGSSGINLPSEATPHDKKMSEIVKALNNLRMEL